MDILPISTSLKEDSMNGSFQYLKNTRKNQAVKGIFAFSFYLIPEDIHTYYDFTENIYLEGLGIYTYCIERENSVFKDWKVVIYTDISTYELLQTRAEKKPSLKSLFLLENPNVDYVIVDWPYYSPDGKAVNGDVLRVMRLRAFFDFPTIPVFVRDADTIWSEGTSYRMRYIAIPKEGIYEWEENYYLNASKLPNTFFFGTSLHYKKPWHLESSLGAFAGLQSIIPTVPCFQSLDLWNQSIDTILSKSVREKKENKIVYSNKNKPQIRIGKDEQILLFIFLPACFQHIFFFELDLYRQRTFELKEESLNSKLYPSVIFERGSNNDISDIFKGLIGKKSEQELQEMTNEVKKKFKLLKKQKENDLNAFYKMYTDDINSFLGSDDTFFGQHSMSIFRTLSYNLPKVITTYDPSFYKNYEKIMNIIQQFKNDFDFKFKYLITNSEIQQKKDEYKNLLELKKKAFMELMEYTLSIVPKQQLFHYLYKSDIPHLTKMIEYYELQKKKGGRRKQRYTRRHSSRKQRYTRRNS